MNPSSAQPKRCSTGIAGLDEILGGGLTSERLYLIEGEPGTGKTTLALQFLLDGVRQGEKCLYVTLSETENELREVAASHGWALEGLDLHELSALESALQAESSNTIFHPSEVELNETVAVVLSLAERTQATRVVFDSLSEMRLLARDPLRYRRQVLAIKQFFSKRSATVLFLDDQTVDQADLQLQSIAHGVVSLESSATEHGSARRRLRVIKMRGLRFRDGFHDYLIERGGMVVYPRLVASNHPSRFGGAPVSSGNAGLDRMLGGGLDRGTSTVVLGPAGVGKSTLCTQYAYAAAQRDEGVAIITFEETREVLLARARGMGLPLERALETGRLTVRQVDPAELSPGELVHLVREAVEKNGAGTVVIDSLNGYLNSMPEERFLVVQLHELLTFLNQRCVNSFLIVAQHGLLGSMQTPVDVTYLADNVLLLRYFEAEGAVRQALSVVKKRTGEHEKLLREFRTTTGGIQIGEPLSQFRGVLTGVPVFHGQRQDLLRSKE